MSKADERLTGSDDAFPALITAARAGSREALGTLLHHYRSHLLVLANQRLPHYLRTKVSPSDVVQQSYLDAQQAFARFEGQTREELLGWLRQILRCNLGDFSRHWEVSQKRAVRHELAIADLEAAGLTGALMVEQSSPGSRAERAEERERLQQALEELPADYQAVIRLRHRERLSFDKIAQQLNRSPTTVRRLWAHAIRALQQRLG